MFNIPVYTDGVLNLHIIYAFNRLAYTFFCSVSYYRVPLCKAIGLAFLSAYKRNIF